MNFGIIWESAIPAPTVATYCACHERTAFIFLNNDGAFGTPINFTTYKTAKSIPLKLDIAPIIAALFTFMPWLVAV